MELGGDAKRIRALFSELSLEDQIAAPRFEQLWQRAASTRPTQPRRFTALVAVISTAIVLVALSMVVWSRYRSSQTPPQQNAFNAMPQEIAPPAVLKEQAPEKVDTAPRGLRSHPHRRKTLTVRRERSVMAEAAMLSSWQSPTGIFLESPSSSRFSSLPQLNQSAEDLKSFLPKNNER